MMSLHHHNNINNNKMKKLLPMIYEEIHLGGAIRKKYKKIYMCIEEVCVCLWSGEPDVLFLEDKQDLNSKQIPTSQLRDL